MGCGNCGTSANGKPGGCKSNGGCSSGGCNRMNVFDWLSALPLHDSAKPYPIVEVTFNKGSRKEFYRNNTPHILEKSDWITVEGASGFDVGQVSLTGELVKLQMKKYGVTDKPDMKRVLRPSTDDDIRSYNDQKVREQDVMVRSRAMARQVGLEMKIAEVEIQADGKKATFFYTADQRVDFRELIKLYASEFRVKVEMRQIGARQESAKVGGIGSCGRELCCSTWLTDFKSVNTAAARYQNLSINQTKLSGQCGRLKCCLNYELDTYMDALRIFPAQADKIETTQGVASLQKRDIFKMLMWYSYPGSNKQYPMTIERVKEIVTLNKQGIKPEELQAVELETATEKKGIKPDAGFVNDVGQISLRALERNSKKQRSKGKSSEGRGQEGRKQGPQQGGEGKKQAQGQKPQQGGAQGQGQQKQARPQGEGRKQGQQQQGGGNKPQQQARPQGQSRPQQPKQQGGGGQPQNKGQQKPRPEGNNASAEGGQQQGQGQKPNNRNRPPRPKPERSEDKKPQE